MTTDTDRSDDTLDPVELTPSCTLRDVQGLADEVALLRQTIVESATTGLPAEMRTLGVCLNGPLGSGKRRVARALTGSLVEAGYQSMYFPTLEDIAGSPADSIEAILQACRKEQPQVVVLDCFDEAHVREATVRAFMQQIDEIRSEGDDVVVIAIIDSHLVFQGAMKRFVQTIDLNITIQRPDIDRRRRILTDSFGAAAASTDGLNYTAVDIDRIARETDQFGVDDLYNLARRAVSALHADIGPAAPLETADISSLIDQMSDERLQNLADGYALSDVDVPEVGFDDMGGLDEAKQKLREQVQQALERDGPGASHRSGSSGILLHGPPGTGKTMLVQALATEMDYTLIPVSGPQMKSRQCGGPGAKLPKVFERAERNSPAILFFDEFDTLGGKRGTEFADSESVNTLLTELDGLGPRSDIVVIGATNLPDMLDSALLRPGRFDYHVEVDVPDRTAQAEIFSIQAADLPLAVNVDGDWFAQLTRDVTGADIATICERAATVAARDTDTPTTIMRRHFEAAYNEFQEGRIDRVAIADGMSRAFQ